MQSFQQAIDSDPEFADAYSALGQTCFDLGAYQEAVVALEKAVKLNPKATDAYTLLGQAYAKSKEKGSVQEKPIDLNATESTLVSTKPDSNDDDKRVPEIDLTKVYYVGLSDVLDIRLPGRAPEESTLFVVAGNGYIDHPILGRPIKVLGLTTEQIVALFSAELKRLSIGNQIAPEVSVRDFNSHTIMVSGLVKEPGTKILRREAIPLYVVLADAQLASEAAIVDVMSQGNVKHRKIELSQPDQTAVLVRPGDVVTVRAATKQFFYVGGNVKAPGELPYRSGLTLTQAILSAGGVSIKGEKVQLTRGQGNGLLTLQEFKLKEINSGKTPDPLIEPGDRITVLP
jgi:polysaccharide export outer membrane protein